MNGSALAAAGLIGFVLSTVAVPVAAQEGPAFSTGRRFDQRSGESLYRSICQGCHMADGEGARGAATYPALARNARLASAAYPAVVVLSGVRNMPSFSASLDDAQVAAVVNYVRSHFGNAYGDGIQADHVAALRRPR